MDENGEIMTKDFEIEEGKEVVRRTIVGGRPLARRKRTLRIPIGIEKVLCKAAVDPMFRRALFDDRESALAGLGDELTPDEAGILKSTTNASLETMVARIDPPKHSKRRFMRGVMAATLAAMTAGGAIGCDSDSGEAEVSHHEPGDLGGMMADDVKKDNSEPLLEVRERVADAGALADLVEVHEGPDSKGIGPDVEEPDVVVHEDLMAPEGIIPDAE